MPYMNYRTDMHRAWKGFSKPGKEWVKAVLHVHDPFRLFGLTMRFVVHVIGFAAKAIFFAMRKTFNR